MKKTKLLYAVVVALLLLSGCAGREEIEFPFAVSDVDYIEMYRYTVPADAQEKVVTEMEDVEKFYDSFSGRVISPKETEDDTAGGTTTSFRFNLSDGTEYEVLYIYGEGRTGTIRFMSGEKEYAASADIAALWEECECEPRDVHESRLPGDPCGLETKPIVGTELMPGALYSAGI